MFRERDIPHDWWNYFGEFAKRPPPVVAFPVGVPITRGVRAEVMRHVRWILKTKEELPDWRIPTNLRSPRGKRWLKFREILERRKGYILIESPEEAQIVWRCCHYTDKNYPDDEREPVRLGHYYNSWPKIRNVLRWLGNAREGHPLETLAALDQEPSSAISSRG